MKVIFVLALITILSAPYCVDNQATVGDIAKDVRHVTEHVVDAVKNKNF